MLCEKEDINAAFEDNYKHLFGAHTCQFDKDAALRLISLLTRLCNNDCILLNEPLTISETGDAIDALLISKTPGPDGLPSEFYKRFKDLLCPFFLALFNEAYRLKSLPPTFSYSQTILIPKRTDPDKLRNVDVYRPIALCNVDYEIFERVFARRLQSVVSTVVGSHQTCGSKGSSIVTCLHVARSCGFFFCANKKSVDAALCLTESFCRAVGAVVNKAKNSGFWVGSWAAMSAECAGIAWTLTAASYLGVPLHCYRNSALYW